MNDYTYVDNNLVKLQVFFKEMVYVDYTESPSYPVSPILANNKYCIRLLYISVMYFVYFIFNLITHFILSKKFEHEFLA